MTTCFISLLTSRLLHYIVSARRAIRHSQSLARWLSVLCQMINWMALQSTWQPLHDS